MSSEPAQPSHRFVSTTRTVAAIFSEQILVVFVTAIATGLTACVALLAVNAWQATEFVLERMMGATKVVIFLDPKSARSDVEGAGAWLQTQPAITGIRFRPKGDALSSVDGARAEALSLRGEISTPQAWEALLRVPNRTEGSKLPSLILAAEQLQSDAMRLRGVESVRFDRIWVSELDRSMSEFEEASKAVLVTIATLALILLFGAFFLASRALTNGLMVDRADPGASKLGVNAYIGIVFAGLAGVATVLLYALAVVTLREFVTHFPRVMQPWLHVVSQSTAADMMIVAGAILGSAMLASLLSAQRG